MTYGNDLSAPTLIYNKESGEPNGFERGLTKREYFAALAMQGMLSNETIINNDNWEWIAENSVKQADELIKKLNH